MIKCLLGAMGALNRGSNWRGLTWTLPVSVDQGRNWSETRDCSDLGLEDVIGGPDWVLVTTEVRLLYMVVSSRRSGVAFLLLFSWWVTSQHVSHSVVLDTGSGGGTVTPGIREITLTQGYW